MLRHVIRYGLIAGLIAIVPMSWMVLRPGVPMGQGHSLLFGYLTMLVALTAVFLGIKHYRDTVLGGVVRFGPALLLGLAISFVASLVYALGWELALAWSGSDFAGSYARAMVAAAQAKGASPQQLQQVTAEADKFVKSYGDPFYRLPMTFLEIFPVGVLISLISAGLLRNRRFLPRRQPPGPLAGQ